MTLFRMVGLTAVLVLVACRGRAQDAEVTQEELNALVESMMPSVAQATGLEFKRTPLSGIRTREQVGQFLLNKLNSELPPDRLQGIGDAYRLLGLLPDSLDIAALFVNLYTEQVAGFYEPDSLMLFAVGGTDRVQLRLILAHELVHALQHQYLSLDSIMDDRADADRLAAAQAILEGQAQVASMVALYPDRDILSDNSIWDIIGDQLTTPSAANSVFNNAPLVIRTGLIFPYLQGSEFMRWFRLNRPRDQPFAALMPQSTEQILHPTRYAAGDVPVMVRFVAGDSGDVTHEDTFGEFEIMVLRSALAGIDAVATDLPLGWGGDRMRVYDTPDGPALVWYTVWDTPVNASAFHDRIAIRLLDAPRPGYRKIVEQIEVGGRAAIRIVIAPQPWSRWENLPLAEVR